MGRLTKAKIDAIVKSRKAGYTQRETAEKEKVHIRTVRKYDPLHQARPKKRSIEDRVIVLEELAKTFMEHIGLLYQAAAHSDSGIALYEDNFDCPRCNSSKLSYCGEEDAHVCAECGHKIFDSRYYCNNCLSQTGLHYAEETGDYICEHCGARRMIPLV